MARAAGNGCGAAPIPALIHPAPHAGRKSPPFCQAEPRPPTPCAAGGVARGRLSPSPLPPPPRTPYLLAAGNLAHLELPAPEGAGGPGPRPQLRSGYGAFMCPAIAASGRIALHTGKPLFPGKRENLPTSFDEGHGVTQSFLVTIVCDASVILVVARSATVLSFGFPCSSLAS